MTLARSSHTDNIIIGAGELFIERYPTGSNEPSGGERYLGDSVSASLAITTERTTVDSGDGPVSRALVDIVRRVTRELRFTLHDASVANLGLFVIDDGKPGEDAAAATLAAQHELLGLQKDGWHQIGSTAALPGGLGAIPDDTTFEKSADGANWADASVATTRDDVVDATDILLDAPAGRLLPLKDQRIRLKAETAASATLDRTTAGADSKQIICALRYVEDARAGQGRNIYIRKCTLVASGEASIKSVETEQRFDFIAAAGDAGGGWPQIAIDGKPVE